MRKTLMAAVLVASSVTHAQTERIRTFESVTLDVPENVQLVFYDSNIDTSKTFIIGQETDTGKVQYSFCKTTATMSEGSFTCGEIGEPLSSTEIGRISSGLEKKRKEQNEIMGTSTLAGAAVGGAIPVLVVSACLLTKRCFSGFTKGSGVLTGLVSGVTAGTGAYLSYEISGMVTDFKGEELDSGYLRQIWMDSMIRGTSGDTPTFIKIDSIDTLNRTLSLVHIYKSDLLKD